MILFQSLTFILLLTLGGLVLLFLGSDAVENPFKGRRSQELRRRVQLTGLVLSIVGLVLIFFFTCFPSNVWWGPEGKSDLTALHVTLVVLMMVMVSVAAAVQMIRQVGGKLVCYCAVLLLQILTFTFLGASTFAMVMCLVYLGGMIALYFGWNLHARTILSEQEAPPFQGVMVVVATGLLGVGLIGGSNLVILHEAVPVEESIIESRPPRQISEAEVTTARAVPPSLVLVLGLLGGSVAAAIRFSRIHQNRSKPLMKTPPVQQNGEQ